MAKTIQGKHKTKPFKVDTHPQRLEIQRDIASSNLTISEISRKYGIHWNAIHAYKKKAMPQHLMKISEARDITNSKQLFEIILKSVSHVEKLADSCDRELQDPENPEFYQMGPMSTEVKITYEVQEGDKTYKKKATLQELLDAVESGGYPVTGISTKNADPRVLLIKASDTLAKNMDTLVSAWKTIDQGSSAFIGTPAWNQVVQAILKATEAYPEVRRTIAEELDKIAK